jgi:hypothetical protein
MDTQTRMKLINRENKLDSVIRYMAMLIQGRRRYLNHNRVPALLFDPVAGVGQENKCTSKGYCHLIDGIQGINALYILVCLSTKEIQ